MHSLTWRQRNISELHTLCNRMHSRTVQKVVELVLL